MVAVIPLLAIFHFFLLSAAIPLSETAGSGVDSSLDDLPSSAGTSESRSFGSAVPTSFDDVSADLISRASKKYRFSLVNKTPMTEDPNAYFIISTNANDKDPDDQLQGIMKLVAGLKKKYDKGGKGALAMGPLLKRSRFDASKVLCQGPEWRTFEIRLADVRNKYKRSELIQVSAELRGIVTKVTGGTNEGSQVDAKFKPGKVLPEVKEALDKELGQWGTQATTQQELDLKKAEKQAAGEAGEDGAADE